VTTFRLSFPIIAQLLFSWMDQRLADNLLGVITATILFSPFLSTSPFFCCPPLARPTGLYFSSGQIFQFLRRLLRRRAEKLPYPFLILPFLLIARCLPPVSAPMFPHNFSPTLFLPDSRATSDEGAQVINIPPVFVACCSVSHLFSNFFFFPLSTSFVSDFFS